jgi:hypothetical protein
LSKHLAQIHTTLRNFNTPRYYALTRQANVIQATKNGFARMDKYFFETNLKGFNFLKRKQR